MDITPLVPRGRQIIQAYGSGGFTIAGVRHHGSVLVFPSRTQAWPVARIGDLAPGHLAMIAAAGESVEFLLLGAGAEAPGLASGLGETLKSAGIAVEVMDTGAACRTFNVLVAEDRRLAAALIAVD